MLLIYTFSGEELCWYDVLEKPAQWKKKKRVVQPTEATAASSPSPYAHCPKSAGWSIKIDLEALMAPKCSDGVVLAAPSQPADPSPLAPETFSHFELKAADPVPPVVTVTGIDTAMDVDKAPLSPWFVASEDDFVMDSDEAAAPHPEVLLVDDFSDEEEELSEVAGEDNNYGDGAAAQQFRGREEEIDHQAVPPFPDVMHQVLPPSAPVPSVFEGIEDDFSDDEEEIPEVGKDIEILAEEEEDNDEDGAEEQGNDDQPAVLERRILVVRRKTAHGHVVAAPMPYVPRVQFLEDSSPITDQPIHSVPDGEPSSPCGRFDFLLDYNASFPSCSTDVIGFDLDANAHGSFGDDLPAESGSSILFRF